VPCEVLIDDVQIEDASCSGIDDGAISITASGGELPYEYSLDGINYGSASVFSGLAPGAYTVYVRDNTGCFVTLDISIGVGPGPSLGIPETEDASCGIANGSINIDASGGTIPYSYSIDGVNYGASGLFTGLSAGDYSVYLVDNAGCRDTIDVTINATNAPVINNIQVTDASCGNEDGSITINATGGLGALQYSIDGFSFQSSPVFNDLASGTYTVYVRDESGCQVTGTATIVDAGGPDITAVDITEANCGQNDGSILITATGNPPLQYSINGTNYFASNTFNNLSAGNYTVYVRDVNGCIASQPVTLNTIDGPQINNVLVADTECGENNGSITILATGGTGTLQYSLNGGPLTDETIFSDLSPGDYEVLVVDENGCEATQNVTIEPSEGPEFDVYITPANCGKPDGIIELDGFGGAGGYSYSINGGPFGPSFTFTNRPSDFYTVAIRDAAGCIYEEEVFLYENEGPDIDSVAVTDPDCGMNNGTITIYADGSSDLEYSIALPFYQSSNVFDPVAPGIYTITVRDEAGCTATSTAMIVAKPAPIINNILVTDTECGLSIGSIEIIASGGTPPLMYSIGGSFVSSNIFTGLGSGTYTVVVKGSNDCEISQDVTVQATGSQFSALDTAICEGESITIETQTFTVAGNYDIVIPGGAANGCDSTIQLTLTVFDLEEQVINRSICEGEILTLNGIDYTIAGQYVLDTIQAISGCDTIRTLDLEVNPLETTLLEETICTGGVFTINGIDYTIAGDYLIDTVNAVVGCDSIRTLRLTVSDFNEKTIAEQICEGEVYTINGVDYAVSGLYVVDTLQGPGGCDTILSLNLAVNSLPTATAGADQQIACDIPSVILNGSSSGGTPEWSGPGIDAGNQNILQPTVTVSGEYILTITSPEGCVDMDTVNVTLDPSTVVADAGPGAFLSCDIDTLVLQANPVGTDYLYQWSGPDINASNEHDPNPVITLPGIYTLVVTDTITDCVSAPDTVVITNIAFDIVAVIQDPISLTCFSTLIDLNATGSSVGPNIIYIWIDEEGNVIGDSPLIEVSTEGTFMFTVKDTLSGCFDNDTVFVEDLTLYPPVDAGEPQQLDCNTSVVTLNEGATSNLPNIVFDWEGPLGGILTPDHLLSIDAGIAGEYYLTAIDTVTGCINSDSVLVTDLTQLPLADIDILEFFTCVDSLALIDIGSSDTGSGIVYEWNGPGVNSVSETSIEPGQPGVYYLTVMNEATGCIAFDTVLLEFPDLPVSVDIDITIPICAGDSSGSFTIGDVTGGTPLYMFTIDGIDLQGETFFDSLAAGDYILTVVDANGCSFNESIHIPDGEVLTIDIGPDIEIQLGDSIQLSANVNLPWSLIDSIVWQLDDHLSCTHCIDPTLYGILDEIISATVYSGSCEAMDQIQVRVDVSADVYIPNVFSPNHDGRNDIITVFADSRVRRVVFLEIFDRWGNMVFKGGDFLPNDLTKGWDGTFKDQPMNPAVFAYTAQVELLNGSVLSFHGDITLVR
jgi:gliding motility-associated-like protein